MPLPNLPPDNIESLRWRDIVNPGEGFHLARVRQRDRPGPARLHTHADFAEVFWVESGRGVHEVNGERCPLAPGAFAAVRARDRHGFGTVDGVGFVMVNVAFPAATWGFLRRRYAADLPPTIRAPLGVNAGRQPFGTVLSAARLNALTEAVARLGAGARTRLVIEGFLAALWHDLAADAGGHAAAGNGGGDAAPGWLRAALTKLGDPLHFAAGPRGLARLAGRCPEHVNRALRRHYGVTATEAINRARLDHAARLLRVGAGEIADVALDCGFNNLGHFYELFGARFGQTPRAYRRRHHALVS